jgi:phage shock protein PspC (stress-responsive transcriptional regulator)
MKLCRTRGDRRIAGVCGGLAKYLGWGSTKVRIIWVLATIFTAFAGVIVYLVLWFLMPEELPSAPAFESATLQPWKRSL